MEAALANLLDAVTQDDSDEASPLERAITIRPVHEAEAAPSPDNALVQAVQPEAPSELMQGLQALKDYIAGNVSSVNNMAKRFTNYDRQFTEDVLNLPRTIMGNPSKADEVGQRLMGGENWLTNMVKSAVPAAGRALAADQPITSEQMIAPAQDMAGLVSSSMLFGKPGAGTLGSGPMRPGASVVPTPAAPVFYSALEHAATNAAQDVMSPQQWLGYLKNQPGVKPEELQWTGLGDWLGGQKGKVSKQDVQAYLDEHKVEINDVTKGDEGGKPYEDLSPDELEAVKQDYKESNGIEPGEPIIWDDVRDHYEATQEEFGAGGSHGTKYSSYQLPGGDNYREHLLTLPTKKKTITNQDEANYNKYARMGYDERVAQGVQPEYERLVDMDLPLHGNEGGSRVGQQAEVADYRSSHWDEPNVLAHVRTNDRLMPRSEPADPAAWAARMAEFRDKFRAISKELESKPGWPANVANDPRVKALEKEYGVPDNASPAQLEAWERGGGSSAFRLRNKTSGNTTKPFDTIEQAEAHLATLPEKLRPNLEVVSAAKPPAKSLHIEEIQSDWHQQGRKQGYKEGVPKEQIEAALNDASASRVDLGSYIQELAKERGLRLPDSGFGMVHAVEAGEMGKIPSWLATPEFEHLAKEHKTAYDKHGELLRKTQGVPDAPFKTSWPELALKRMIRKAAEEGYDRISWTPGEAQAARYDLSKSVKKVHYDPDLQGGTLAAEGLDGRTVLDKQGVKPDQIGDYVGKDVAKKLLETERSSDGIHSLEGLDLKVGGEGMREFYDKMLPKIAERIGKAHGVKVKQASLPNAEQFELYGPDKYAGNRWHVMNERKETVSTHATEAEAKKALAERQTSSKVHYFDLPQSLKDHATGKGFPLFMSGVPFPLSPVDHDPFKKKEK